MIKAIILDCFGVLVGRGFEETYRTAGGDPQKDRIFIEDMLARTNVGSISQSDFDTAMASKLGISDEHWQQTLKQVELPNMELLDYIRTSHKGYKLVVLSNANRGLIEYIESMVGKNRFDDIIVSAEVGLIKPDPEIYRYTANKIGVKPAECVFIDDHESHLVTARDLGMKTILYKDFMQTRGELEKLLSRS